jgi:hypothetical protein
VIEIRSYRRVFDLERRIYSIDTLRLNPGGVPVRGLAYFLVVLGASVLAARLPLAGSLLAAVPWYLADLAFPILVASLLSVLRLDGRSFHVSARALLVFWIAPRRLSHLRRCGSVGRVWRPDAVVLLPDGSDSRMRRLRYTGPGAALVACEHERRGRATAAGSVGFARRGSRSALIVRELPRARPLAEGKVIVLARGARLLVRGAKRGAGR